MRVGLVCDTAFPLVGGAEVHVQELARFMIEQGIEVELFTSTPSSEDAGVVRVTRVPMGQSKVGFVLRSLLGLWRFSRRHDVLHCHYTSLLTALGAFAARLRGKRVVTTLHGLGTLDTSVQGSLIKKILRYASFKLSTTIIATSDEMAEVARRFVPDERVVVIPNCTDTDQYCVRSKTQQKLIIGSVRRVVPKNGVQYLIEAAPSVLRHFPDAELWIVGSGRTIDYVKERTRALDIERHVRFLGEVQNSEVIGYLREMDVVVFPSSAESTSIACLEAMAMGKAVVASSVGAYPYMIGENERGLLVRLFDRESSDYNAPLQLPQDRIDALADAIVRLLQDHTLRRQVGESARAFAVQRHSWQNRIKEIVALYG